MDYNQAQERVNQLKKFYKGLLWFAIIAGIVFFNDIFEEGRINFSLLNGSIIFVIWGIILTVKAVKLFILDSDWEREIIEKEMRKSKNPHQF